MNDDRIRNLVGFFLTVTLLAPEKQQLKPCSRLGLATRQQARQYPRLSPSRIEPRRVTRNLVQHIHGTNVDKEFLGSPDTAICLDISIFFSKQPNAPL